MVMSGKLFKYASMEQETIRKVNDLLGWPSDTDPLDLPEDDEEDMDETPVMRGGLFDSPLF